MKKHSRREALATMAAGGASLALSGFTANAGDGANPLTIEEQAAASQPARAFRGQHQPRPLPFDPSKLKGLSEKLIRSHWQNNYSGSVRALNAVEQRLDALLKEKDLPAYIYGDLKREELMRTGSVILHEHYFANLGGDGKVGGEILNHIKHWFGSYEQWEEEFKKTAAALAGGSGWAMLCYSLHTGEMHNYWAWDHMHNATMARPLLVLDMYEHSYHMDYGAVAARYIDAFMQNIDWEEVDRQLAKTQKAAAALKA